MKVGDKLYCHKENVLAFFLSKGEWYFIRGSIEQLNEFFVVDDVGRRFYFKSLDYKKYFYNDQDLRAEKLKKLKVVRYESRG